MLLPPPPQAGTNTINASNARRNRWERRPGTPMSAIEKTVQTPRASHCAEDERGRKCSISEAPVVVAAVVVTVTVAGVVAGDPVAATEEGLNWQAAPVGSPEQESVMVPLNPVDEDTLNDACPELPGEEITTVDGEGVVG